MYNVFVYPGLRRFVDEASGPLALMAGVLAAHALIYVAIGWEDGFETHGLWSLKRYFIRRLPWVLGVAIPLGAMLDMMHKEGESAGREGKAGAKWILLAIPRIFLHFPFYGAIVLFQAIAWFVFLPLRAVFGKVTGRSFRQVDLQERFEQSSALRFMIGPLNRFSEQTKADLPASEPSSVALFRMLRFLPILPIVLWLWTGATSEETGDRVDPRYLSLAASFWIGDFLVLTSRRLRAWAFEIGSNPEP